MEPEERYRKYLPEYNHRYEIDRKFKEAFTILRDLGARVPEDFYNTLGKKYETRHCSKEQSYYP